MKYAHDDDINVDSDNDANKAHNNHKFNCNLVSGNAFVTLRLLTRGSVTEPSGEYLLLVFVSTVLVFVFVLHICQQIVMVPMAGTWWTMGCKTSTTFSQTALKSQSS